MQAATTGARLDGRYEVRAVLGAGAQAVVVRADGPYGRPVAIKVFAPDAPEDRVQAALAEARLLAGLRHPNLVRVLDAGVAEGRAFVVMELVDGPSLAEVLARHRRLSPADALPLFEQIASALACAHAAGVVHRDVKPANVLLHVTAAGDVVAKLVDFGVASTSAADRAARGALIGTPVYMAPEQAIGRPVDPRADLYALGGLMFRALTGYRPFPGDDAISAAVAHLTCEVPRFDEVVPELALPPALERIVRKCLEKDPDRRYASAEALLADLAAFRRGEPLGGEARPRRRRWRPVWPIFAAGLAGIVTGLFLS